MGNPVVKPTSAPFFLPPVPTLSGELKFDIPDKDPEGELSSKILTSSAADFERNYSAFGQKLSQMKGEDDDDSTRTPSSEDLMSMLKEKGPSAIEVELQNLAPEGGGSLELMAQFLRLTAICLRSKFNYELTQSYLALFLKLHSEYIIQSPELMESLKSLQGVQDQSWTELKKTMGTGASLVGFCKSSTV